MRSKGGVILLLLVVLAIGFAFYRGYLTLSSQQQPSSNNTEIKLTVDQQKAAADAKEASSELERMSKKVDLNPVD